MFRQSMCLASLVLVLACAWTARGAVNLNTGLVAWWSFDEGEGATAYDGSGNNNHATLMGGATWTTPGAPGREGGKAISLNGTSAFLRVEHSPSLDLTNAMTYEMWVYYTGTPADALLCKGVSGDGNAWKNLGIRLDDDPVTLRQINWRSRGGDTVNALNSRTGLPLANGSTSRSPSTSTPRATTRKSTSTESWMPRTARPIRSPRTPARCSSAPRPTPSPPADGGGRA